MYRAASVLAIVLLGSSMVAVAGDSDEKQVRAEIVAKADSIFKRYIPRAGQPLRTFDKERESQAPDSVIYWFDANYVVRLILATDGSLVRVELLPEALLYSDSWMSVPDTVELGPGEMERLIDVAGQLRPMGKKSVSPREPHFCFQSGPNLYCGDGYELAQVSTYRRELVGVQPPQSSLRHVSIAYKQPVSGVVSEVKTVSENERQLKVGALWYRITKEPDQSWFDNVAVGSMVHLTVVGCAGNELACAAFPTDATPPKL